MSETGQTFPSGILDLTGCTSGEAFQYDALSVSDMTIFMVHFESTYEAIEKHILPPPLKADRSPPPQVQMWYFSSRNTLAMDGRITPYKGFQFGSDSILMQLWCSMAAVSTLGAMPCTRHFIRHLWSRPALPFSVLRRVPALRQYAAGKPLPELRNPKFVDP